MPRHGGDAHCRLVPLRRLDRPAGPGDTSPVLDVAMVVTVVLVCAGIGLPISELIPARFAGRALVAPVLGLAVLSVAAPVTYRWGLSPLGLLIASAAAALIGTAWWARQIARRGVAPDDRRIARTLIIGWLGALIVMMLPRWVGGEQFSVFQGNQWDCFGYLEAALTYSRRAYTVVSTASDAELLRNPLMPIAQSQLLERPSIHLLYAMFSRIAPAEAYRLYYPMLIALQAQCVLVGAFILRAVLPAARPMIWLAAAAVYPIGFWGQYVFDLNAWSQIAASPLLLLIAGIALIEIVEPSPGDELRTAAALAVLVAGAVFLYPEGCAVYLAAIAPTAVAVPVARMIRTRRFAPRTLVPLAGLAGLVAMVLYPPLIEFLIRQVTFGIGHKVGWWKYFQAFFGGRDQAGGASELAAGVFGLYFATPAPDAVAAVAALQRVAIVAVIAGALGALVATCAWGVPETSRRVLLGWAAIAATFLMMVGVLAAQENYWIAGKLLSYAAPVFMTLLAAPIGIRFTRASLRLLRWAAVALVAFQLAMGGIRIAAARDPDGIHYAAPYPSVTLTQFKHGAGWDLHGLDAVLGPRDTVLVTPMDPWLEAYLMTYLYAHRIRFAALAQINTYFHAGRDIGTMAMPNRPTVDIGVDAVAFILHYRDGRPDVRVPTRAE